MLKHNLYTYILYMAGSKPTRSAADIVIISHNEIKSVNSMLSKPH